MSVPVGRRAFLGALSAGLVGAPLVARAQAPGPPARVGWLGRSGGRQTVAYKAFEAGLRDVGYVAGENLLVDVRTPDQDKVEQYPQLAARLVAAGVDVIFASNPYAVEAAANATTTIPIIAVDFESDPIARGWVTSLGRPGKNVSGFFLDIPEISAKQLQMLREVKPNLAKVVALGDARVNEPQFRAAELGAQGARLALQRLAISSLDEVSKALDEAVRQGAGALLVLSSPLMFSGMPRIAEAAAKLKLPSISLFVPFFAEAGGLLAYGPVFVESFRRAASYVDKILKGAQPAELPVQRPTSFEYVVNRKTARSIGLTIPSALLARADRVIQ